MIYCFKSTTIPMLKMSILLICLLLIFNSTELKAQHELTDSMRLERIHYIQNALNSSKTNVNRWWYGWLGIYSAATVVQGAAYIVSNDVKTKQDMALGSAIAALGAGIQALTPLNTGRDAELITCLPESTPAEIQLKLENAEAIFKADAKIEKIGRSWQIHALNEAVNLGSGLITWLAFKRSVWDGVSNFLMNSVVTETQIWTQPHKTMKDYDTYNRKYKSDSNTQASQFRPEYYLRSYPGGVSLSILF